MFKATLYNLLSFTELSKQQRTQDARLLGEAREKEGQGEE
jgi:hypothetical protein